MAALSTAQDLSTSAPTLQARKTNRMNSGVFSQLTISSLRQQATKKNPNGPTGSWM